MTGTTEQPLLVTCLLDSMSQKYFQNLRDKHFPRERNIVPAHVSFFHNLPTAERVQIETTLKSACSRLPFSVEVCAPKFMGNGVMFELAGLELNALHGSLAKSFEPWLIPQDRQKFKPHVVVQNKVTNDVAKQTFAELKTTFEPFTVQAIGLCLWTYLGGPWRLEREFVFETS